MQVGSNVTPVTVMVLRGISFDDIPLRTRFPGLVPFTRFIRFKDVPPVFRTRMQKEKLFVFLDEQA